jgi:hypothetical protein
LKGRARAYYDVIEKTTPLFVVCSPRRCVGKTLLSRLLTEFYAVGDQPIAAFDLADEGPQLADYLPEITTITDISSTRGQIAIFDRIIANSNGATIIDLSHRAFQKFFTVVQEIGFFEEARRCSIEPLILFIVNPDPKSAEAYAMLRRFREASLLPVRNQMEPSAPPYYDPPPNASASVASLNIPLLGFSLRALIDRPSFSFSQLWRMPTGLPAALEGKLLDWVEHVFVQIQNIEPSLTGENTSTRVAASRSIRNRATGRQWELDHHAEPLRHDELTVITQRPIDVPEEILKFVPKKKQRIDGDPLQQAGLAIVAMLQEAAELANENCKRARTMADELSRQLRAAEDRINQLETEIEHFRDRAVRAETWLQLIRKEIEQKLLAPRQPLSSSNR